MIPRPSNGALKLPAGTQQTEAELSSLNQRVRRVLQASLATRALADRLPDGFVTDPTANLVDAADRVDVTMRGFPAERPAQLPAAVIDARNRAILAELEALAPRGLGIDLEQARQVEALTTNHPVVGRAARDIYDPKDPTTGVRTFGFCFGRADFINFELRRQGVPTHAILKAFVVGSIATDVPDFGRPFSNHIVTIVRNRGGGWIAIDPLLRYVGPVAGWVDLNRAASKDNKLFLFISGSQRVNASGGTHARASIEDRSGPASRAIVTTPKGPALGFVVPKNENYLRYYRDMFASLAALPDPHDRMGLVALGWKTAMRP